MKIKAKSTVPKYCSTVELEQEPRASFRCNRGESRRFTTVFSVPRERLYARNMLNEGNSGRAHFSCKSREREIMTTSPASIPWLFLPALARLYHISRWHLSSLGTRNAVITAANVCQLDSATFLYSPISELPEYEPEFNNLSDPVQAPRELYPKSNTLQLISPPAQK